MKLLFVSFLFVLGASSAIVGVGSPSLAANIAQAFSSVVSSLTLLPEAKGRKGSKRIGGYTSKGKGSRYVGGRK